MATPPLSNNNTNPRRAYDTNNSSNNNANNQATTPYKPPLQASRRDANLLVKGIDLSRVAIATGNSLTRAQALPSAQNGFKNLTTLSNGTKHLNSLGKYIPILNVAVGTMNAAAAYKKDVNAHDTYYSKTTRSAFGTAGNILLGAAATTALAATAPIALPVALIAGMAVGGFVGQDIGEKFGSGITSILKIWNNKE